MTHFSFLPGRGSSRARTTKKTIVDLSPWQTAQTLAALAVTAEETEYARQAEHLADHEVDQAFATALRQATIQAQRRTLTGDALRYSQKVDQLQQVVSQDQAAVRQLTSAPELSRLIPATTPIWKLPKPNCSSTPINWMTRRKTLRAHRAISAHRFKANSLPMKQR